jgi:CheY-like chemotaxis protein
MSRVLVVDDEPQILRALGINLRARGYEVDLAPDGERALEVAARKHPDVVVLDLGLPGIDGVDVIRGLRGWTQVPIVVLSVRDAEGDKVAALDAGADDYVTKPFGMDELLARLRAALRRIAPAEEEALVETTDFTIDLAAKKGVSHRPSGTSSKCSFATAVASSRRRSSYKRSGAPSTTTRRTTSGCSWPRCVGSSNRSRRTLATSSPSPAWGTASNPEARRRDLAGS